MKAYVFDAESNGLDELVIDRKGNILPEATIVHLLVLRAYPSGEATVYRNNGTEDTIAAGWKELCTADVVIGHNCIQHDLPILRRLYGGDVQGRVFDTLVAARLLWPDAKYHPFGGNSVEAFGKKLGLKKVGTDISDWSMWTPEMEARCIRDTEVQTKIFEYLKPKLHRFKAALRLEQRVANIIARQKDSGVCIDLDAAEKLIDQLALEQAECLDQLHKDFPPRVEEMKTPQYWYYEVPEACDQGHYGQMVEKRFAKKGDAPAKVRSQLKRGPNKIKEHPFNPGSSMQIAERLKELYGWEAPTTDAGTPSVTEDTLHGLHFPEAKLLLRYQMASKRMQHLKDWTTRARNSRTPGCIHPSINTNGAATGRMTHQQPNQTACPKVKMGDDGPIMGFDGRYGFEMRSCWGPRPGWVQVGGDASGLELRMLGGALARWDNGAYAHEVVSGDVHTLNQNAGGLYTRDQSKNTIYAYLYGAGDEKIGTTIADHPSLDADQLAFYRGKSRNRIGKEFRQRFRSKIPALAKLSDWCQQAASEKGFIPLPDGRHAPVRSAHSALNTLLQGSGAIVMKLALVLHHDKLVRRGYKWDIDFAYMLNAHDEFQLQCRPEIAKEVGQLIPWSIAEAGRRLHIRCELDGDYKIGSNWAHTH